MKRTSCLAIASLAWLGILYLYPVPSTAEDSDRFVFVNELAWEIELRYWDTLLSKGCGTLRPGEECEFRLAGEDSHYCWQNADEGGRNCDPVEDGCSVTPGRIVIDGSPATERCRYRSG